MSTLDSVTSLLTVCLSIHFNRSAVLTAVKVTIYKITILQQILTHRGKCSTLTSTTKAKIQAAEMQPNCLTVTSNTTIS